MWLGQYKMNGEPVIKLPCLVCFNFKYKCNAHDLTWLQKKTKYIYTQYYDLAAFPKNRHWDMHVTHCPVLLHLAH
jgi:hypothetical protein